MLWQDGSRHVDPAGPMRAGVVMDNLIHKEEMPVTIGVFVDPGIFKQQLQVHVKDARCAIGALDVASDPEQALGDPAQHDSAPLTTAGAPLLC